MGTSLLVSEQKYLTTSYEPDREYDQGELQDRPLGERPHEFHSSNLARTFVT